MNDIEKQAEHYRKLRGWMSNNVKEGWSVVEGLGAVVGGMAAKILKRILTVARM